MPRSPGQPLLAGLSSCYRKDCGAVLRAGSDCLDRELLVEQQMIKTLFLENNISGKQHFWKTTFLENNISGGTSMIHSILKLNVEDVSRLQLRTYVWIALKKFWQFSNFYGDYCSLSFEQRYRFVKFKGRSDRPNP